VNSRKGDMRHVRQSSCWQTGVPEQDGHEPLGVGVRRKLLRLAKHLDPSSGGIGITSLRFSEDDL